ncbi:MAG: nucleotide-binding protein [Planctomycetota bacterium]
MDRLIFVVGSYGSGKTEIAVNLAFLLAARGATVQLADLDLVNPYFRSREARELLEAQGIRVVVPPPRLASSDLPIVVPEIRGMLRPPAGTISLFDIGGDDVGARVLGSLSPDLATGDYELWQVINAQRPFTGAVDGCLAMQRDIEGASRLRVTGLLANSHLIDETTPETVLTGWRLAREVAQRSGLPIRAVAMLERLADAPALVEAIEAPVLPLRRTMVPPWLARETVVRPGEDVNGTHQD